MFSNRLIVAAALILFFTAYRVEAAPHHRFDQSGAVCWVPSLARVHGLFSLRQNRIMTSWSEQDPETGEHRIYRQIYSEDGEAEFNEAQVINNQGDWITCGAGCQDDSGNIYVVWTAYPRPDSILGILRGVKFDANGEAVWGANPIDIVELNGSFITPIAGDPYDIGDKVIPNPAGGFYFINRCGRFSITADGRDREGWRWNNERLRSARDRFLWADADKEGGFWVSYVEIPEERYLYNRYLNNGEKLWDVPRELHTQLPAHGQNEEDIRQLFNSVGYEAGFVSQFLILGLGRGVSVFDGQGNLQRQDDLLYLPSADYSSKMLPLPNSHFGVVYRTDANNVKDYYLQIVDPQNNRYALNDAILVHQVENGQDSIYYRAEPIALSGNSIVVASTLNCGSKYSIDLQTQSRDGFSEWDRQAFLPGAQTVVHAASVEGEAFWVLGGWQSGHGGDPQYCPPYLLNRYDENGRALEERGFALSEINNGIINIKSEFDHNNAAVWIGRDGNYNLLFCQNEGFKHQKFSRDGRFLNEPTGRIVMRSEATYSDHAFYLTDNRILVLGLPEFLGSVNIGKSPQLTAFDINGDSLWSIRIAEGENWNRKVYDLAVMRDSNLAVIAMLRCENQTATAIYYIVDLQNGRVIRSMEGNSIGYQYVFRQGECDFMVVSAGDYFYATYGAHSDSITVQAYSSNGETLWDAPILIRPDSLQQLHDVGVDSSGRLWCLLATAYGYYAGEPPYEIDAHLTSIGLDGEQREFQVYEEPPLTRSRARLQLAISAGNLWIVPDRRSSYDLDSAMTIQCFDTSGQRNTPIVGYLPDIEEGALDFNFQGYTDGKGGIWILWMRMLNEYVGGLRPSMWRVIHLDEDCEAIEGWSRAGEQLGEYENRASSYNSKVFSGLDQDGDFTLVREMERMQYDFHYRMHVISENEIDRARDEFSPLLPHYALSISPNPTNSALSVRYSFPPNLSFRITLTDIVGREVQGMVIKGNLSGSGTIPMNLSEYSSGIYFVLLEGQNKVLREKVILVK